MKHRVKYFLAGLLMSVLFAFTALKVAEHYVRPLSAVEIAGASTVLERREVVNTITHLLQRSWFVSDQKIVDAIRTLNWIENVNVSRSKPDTLHIQIVAKRKISLSRAAQTTNQRIDPTVRTSHLPDAISSSQLMRQVSQASAARGLSVVSLKEMPVEGWVVSVDADFVVVLGSTDMLNRFDRFLIVYDQISPERKVQIQRVDTRYEQGVAVQWRAGESNPVLASQGG